jgi:acetyl esterase/lipase
MAGLFFALLTHSSPAQTNPVKDIFPKGTQFHENISYANDTLKKHLLDIYLPPNAKPGTPLLVWIHGGAWQWNDKYADMGYMRNTIQNLLDSGYALASIDYRFSTQAVFPAQIQDCNLALDWLYKHGATYKIDKNKIGLIGFSAGGHLASLLGVANNNQVKGFYATPILPSFKIRCVVDFYGPAELIALASNPDTAFNNGRDPLSLLLGAKAVDRPDLAKRASPVTYIDPKDPPFLIIQGEKDESVPNTQSIIFHSWLTLTGVKAQLIMVAGAPHYGPMFDAEPIRRNIFQFLAVNLR